ncbi:MAG TPA: hypothetical protein VH116_07090 [Gemmatimonadales bacterium]|jgi:hypothetical protein|nr:hypothetical protein [Gemmatimonadales bacterium]
MADVPIACTLDPADFAWRRDTLLPGLIARAAAAEALSDGARWRFTPESGLLTAVATAIDAERRCCPFLRFQVVAEAEGGPVWLTVTGPPGTRAFLARLPQR